jgi:hypothetical protein
MFAFQCPLHTHFLTVTPLRSYRSLAASGDDQAQFIDALCRILKALESSINSPGQRLVGDVVF